MKLNSCLTLFVGCLLSAGLGAQDFTFQEPEIFLEKSMEFPNVHWYASLDNNTSDSLDLIWLFAGRDAPSEWVINWDAGQDYRPSLTLGDSGRFVMEPNEVGRQLIFGATHNGFSGEGTFDFSVRDGQGQSGQVRFVVHFINDGRGIAENELFTITSNRLCGLQGGSWEIRSFDSKGSLQGFWMPQGGCWEFEGDVWGASWVVLVKEGSKLQRAFRVVNGKLF